MLLPLLSRCHFQTSMKTYVDIMHSISSQASKIFLISRLHSHTHTSTYYENSLLRVLPSGGEMRVGNMKIFFIS